MIPPIDPQVLEAIVNDERDRYYPRVKDAKYFMNHDKNLSSGLRSLLLSYPDFYSELWQHDIPWKDDKGAKSWHIAFRNPRHPVFAFSDLLLHSTVIEGVVDVYVKNKLFVCFKIFGHPLNWQALLKWLWEYGDQREIARSIPQLDPQKLSATFDDLERDSGELLEGDSSVDVTKGLAQKKCLSQDLLRLLNAFDDVFKPRIKLDKSTGCDHDIAWQKWDIAFQKSPFRSLRIQPGDHEGAVDVFGFDKLVKSFQMNDGLQNWKALLDCIWDYGNKRHIAKAEYEGLVFDRRNRGDANWHTASHPQPKTSTKSRSKLKRNSKPLLHQVLRTAGFKNQRESMMPAKHLSNISEAADVLNDVATTAKPVQRQPLVPADPNTPGGKSCLLKDQEGI